MRILNIKEILIGDERYPKILKEIYDPPKKLYVLGDEKILNEIGIAIIGSRKATQYGKKIAYEFANDLSKLGFNIISGLAVGIDSFAHLGTLQENCIRQNSCSFREWN